MLGAVHQCGSCRRGWDSLWDGQIGPGTLQRESPPGSSSRSAFGLCPGQSLYSQCPTLSLAQSRGSSNIWWEAQVNEYSLAELEEQYGKVVNHTVWSQTTWALSFPRCMTLDVLFSLQVPCLFIYKMGGRIK